MIPTLANFIKRFFSHYLPTQKGLAVNTIMAYRDAIKLLLGYASDTLNKNVEQLGVEDINESLVLGFLDHVENTRGCSPRTRNARLAAIRALFGFMAREEPTLLLHSQTIRTIPLKRTEHKTVDYLEEKEMQALLNAVNLDSRTGVRDKALLLLLYNTGARVSEIVELKLPDLRLDGVAQIKLLGKGKKYRSCPLWPETLEALHDYLQQRTPKDPTAQHLFLNANGSPVSRFGVRHIVGKYATTAKSQCPSLVPKTVNPHTLRHTTAMHLLRAGNDVNMVSYWLGHADINTTHTYLEIDMEMKQRMLQKAEAPAVKKPLPWQKPGVLQWLNALAKAPQLCAANY
ncbi:MAG TPA: integrase [Syntrophobacteraceae bacterium]|jgi:integrase/recombinase XerD|nr:integrase [Syntrophobacteraceae bacterium]